MVWFHSCGRETQFERGGLDTKGNGVESRKKRAKQKHAKLGERTSLLSVRPHNHNNPDNTLPNKKILLQVRF